MTKINAKTSTLSLSVSTDLIDSIDAAAKRSGQSRSAYILSWLPETQQEAAAHPPNSAQSPSQRRARVAQPA